MRGYWTSPRSSACTSATSTPNIARAFRSTSRGDGSVRPIRISSATSAQAFSPVIALKCATSTFAGSALGLSASSSPFWQMTSTRPGSTSAARTSINRRTLSTLLRRVEFVRSSAFALGISIAVDIARSVIWCTRVYIIGAGALTGFAICGKNCRTISDRHRRVHDHRRDAPARMDIVAPGHRDDDSRLAVFAGTRAAPPTRANARPAPRSSVAAASRTGRGSATAWLRVAACAHAARACFAGMPG